MIALGILSLLLVLASVSLTVRLGYQGRAEQALAAMVLGSALVLVPVYVLGLTSTLYRSTLIATSAGLFLFSIGASFVGTKPREHLKAIGRQVLDLPRLAVDGLRVTFRARGMAFVAALAVLLLLIWSGVASYVAESDGWDGLGYHEPIIGYTIQYHSMIKRVTVPRLVFLEAINGNPRHCEMTALWMVLLGDRRFVEMPNTFAAPMFLLSIYLIGRRIGSTSASAIGWACATILVPGIALMMRSTYMDMHVAAFTMAAAYFCTKPGFRLADAWPAACAVGLSMGAKITSVAWVPPLAIVAFVLLGRRLVREPERRLRIAGVMLGSLGVALALGGVIYLRNRIMFGSPIWPFGLRIAPLGIDYAGIQSGAEAAQEQVHSLSKTWSDMTSVFKPGGDYADTRVYGYGLAIPFLLLPMAAIGCVAVFHHFGRTLWRSSIGRPLDDQAVTYSFAFLTFWGLMTVVLSPAHWQARYNVHGMAMVALICAWIGARASWKRLGEGALAVAAFANIVYLYWAEPGLVPKPKVTWELLHKTPIQRAAHRINHWTIDENVAIARELNVHKGDLVVYTDAFLFVSIFWNEEFSNILEWWPYAPPAEFKQQLESRNAKWVVTGRSSALAQALAADPKWRKVGRTCDLSDAYERVSK